MPTVSVIITSYNRENCLGEAIESIIKQSFTDWELIIVDDGSTDHAPEIAKQYAEKDNRISLIVQNNGGVAAARNTGVENTTGELIAFLDDDDISHPERLQRQVALMQANPDISACVTNYCPIGTTQGTTRNEKSEWIWQGTGHILRRNVYVALGGYRKFFRLGEDTDFFLRFNERFQYTFIDEVLYFYRKYPSGKGINLTNSPPLAIFSYGVAALYSAHCRRCGRKDPIDNEKDDSNVDKFLQHLHELPLDMRIRLMRGIRNTGRKLIKHNAASNDNMLRIKEYLNRLTCDETRDMAKKYRRWLILQSLRYGKLRHIKLFLS